jgi:UDPglucose--hexose-1-phosphate uridylyltransferase
MPSAPSSSTGSPPRSSRSNPEPSYRSDATYFERLYGEAMIDLSPEEMADGIRAKL